MHSNIVIANVVSINWVKMSARTTFFSQVSDGQWSLHGFLGINRMKVHVLNISKYFSAKELLSIVIGYQMTQYLQFQK